MVKKRKAVTARGSNGSRPRRAPAPAAARTNNESSGYRGRTEGVHSSDDGEADDDQMDSTSDSEDTDAEDKENGTGMNRNDDDDEGDKDGINDGEGNDDSNTADTNGSVTSTTNGATGFPTGPPLFGFQLPPSFDEDDSHDDDEDKGDTGGNAGNGHIRLHPTGLQGNSRDATTVIENARATHRLLLNANRRMSSGGARTKTRVRKTLNGKQAVFKKQVEQWVFPKMKYIGPKERISSKDRPDCFFYYVRGFIEGDKERVVDAERMWDKNEGVFREILTSKRNKAIRALQTEYLSKW